MRNQLILSISLFICFFSTSSCTKAQEQAEHTTTAIEQTEAKVIVGAEQLDRYMPMILGHSIGMVVNQTSMVNNEHLVDKLVSEGLTIKAVFAPEHGFRGTADAGEKVQNGVDLKTGIPIVSLYGTNRKPTPKQLEEISLIIFDIQDVGARFYTYISTLEYVMEACAEQGIPLLILDRPNPNGHFVDGPMLDLAYQSFVGRQQIPVVHGMTVGEYAQFLNGEQLLKNGVQTDVTVITSKNYTHNTHYELPVAPSPNLPNQQSILLYPSLCFFEGTNMSIGRGTNKQFQLLGAPNYTGSFEFMPVSMPGAKYPKFENEICFGEDLSAIPITELQNKAQLNISYLVDAYKYFSANNQEFFLPNNFFDKLAGSNELRRQLEAGYDEFKIRSSWQPDLQLFKEVRKQYLLYPDFEEE